MFFKYEYVKTIKSDELQILIKENQSLLPKFHHIDTVGDEVSINTTEELSVEEKIALDAIINDYVAGENVIIPDVTPRQIRQALVLSGVSVQQIEDAIDSLPEPNKSMARIEWEYSTAFHRNRPIVAQVGAILGWTSEQLDALWTLASSL